MVGGGQGIRIIDASTAIRVGVGQNDDVLVRDACQPVVDALHAASGEVAVRVEGAEVRAHGSGFPYALVRDAHAAVVRRAGYGYDVEAVLQLVERCVGEEGFAGSFGILIEDVHLRLGIAFGQDSHVDAVFHAAALVHVAVRGDATLSALVDEDVIGAHFVGERCRYLVMCILQGYGHDGRLLGEGEEERVFVALLHLLGFGFAQPFLEEAGERGAVNHFAGGLVRHGDFAVTCQWKLVEVVAASCPSGEAA